MKQEFSDVELAEFKVDFKVKGECGFINVDGEYFEQAEGINISSMSSQEARLCQLRQELEQLWADEDWEGEKEKLAELRDEMADFWSREVGKARKKLAQVKKAKKAKKRMQKVWPYLIGISDWVATHAATAGVRFRILISLVQVINGVGVVFSITYPPIFGQMMQRMAVLLFIEVDLGNMMPLGCV